MLLNLRIKSATKVSISKREAGLVLFVKNGLKKAEFEKFLKANKVIPTSKILNRYNDEEKNLISVNPTDGKLEFVKIIKIDEQKITNDFFRNELAGLIQSISDENITELFVRLPEYKLVSKLFSDPGAFYQSACEGLLLGNYDFNEYKSIKKKARLLNVKIVSSSTKELNRGIKSATQILESVYFTRNLINEPAITLTPKELAKRSKAELSKNGVGVTVFNKKQLKEKKMNAILAVGSATPNDPCMIVMRYKPKSKAKKKIALVGKGVTYDTGGLSIKPTSGMVDMKADMAGAAVVIGIMNAAAKLKLPFELVGVVPAVENAIAGNAYKPGDIVKTASGKSIEVKDTDAEGRIILADALEYASKQKPDEIIDFATLTGSVVVALGEYAAGVFTKNNELAEKLSEAGTRSFERVWRLPFWDDYNKLVKSDIADVSNLGPRWGGSITAGKFLEHFVDEKIPWAHLDIAGVALANNLNNYTKKWHTGFGVRLIVDYLKNS